MIRVPATEVPAGLRGTKPEVLKATSTYAKRPDEKMTLAETEALIATRLTESVLPLRVVCRWAVIVGGLGFILGVLAIMAVALR